MSPIFVRPVREQLEHDRLIRHLAPKYKRKFDVAMNAGDEQVAPIKVGPHTHFPDLVLTTGRKLAALVEVETAESVNNLEAMAQWVHFARVRVPFHLYVPVPVYDTARRLCEAHQVAVSEIWTYRPAMEGFDLVRMIHDPRAVAPAGRARPAAAGGRSGARKTKSTKSARKTGTAGAKRASGAKPRAAAKPSKPKPRAARKPARAKPRAGAKKR